MWPTSRTLAGWLACRSMTPCSLSGACPTKPASTSHASRMQRDEDTYDLERTVVGSVVAGVTADRCGQCGARDRSMVPLVLGNREASDMEMTERNKDAPTQTVGGPFAWLVPERCRDCGLTL